MQERGGISPAEFRRGSEAAIKGFDKIRWQGVLLHIYASPQKPVFLSDFLCFLPQTGPLLMRKCLHASESELILLESCTDCVKSIDKNRAPNHHHRRVG